MICNIGSGFYDILKVFLPKFQCIRQKRCDGLKLFCFYAITTKNLFLKNIFHLVCMYIWILCCMLSAFIKPRHSLMRGPR